MKNKIICSILTATMLVASSCNKDYLNPSAASEQQVTTDVNGLITLANGLQYKLTVGRASPGYAMPSAVGLTTKELKVLNAGNTDELNLEAGGLAVQGTNSLISNLWNQSHLVRANADIILNNINIVTDPGTKSGLVAYASIFKALALGNLAMGWEQSPITTGTNVAFVSRAEVLKNAITILEGAATALATAPSANFTSRVVTGIDLKNTVQALIARYSLMAGDNDKALTAAKSVDITKKSAFSYDDNSRNPIFDATFSNRNVTEPNVNFGLPVSLAPTATDKRLAFHFQTALATNNLGRAGFYTANSSAIPVYLPGEISLIIAEANARKDKITDAITELNKVLTKKTDVWGIGADLPAYSGGENKDEVLTEIYKNRCIELFMQGHKLEDNRRFGRPAAAIGASAERSRNWYPYPQAERDNNKSTPADPAL